jgi:hypothetical protein
MISEAMADYVRTLDKEWQHDRTKSVGASEIGLCARKVFWNKHENRPKGVKRDADFEDMWGARIRGTIMESAFWVPAVNKRFAGFIRYSGPDQKTLINGTLSATPDALVVDQPRDALQEFGIDDIGESGCFLLECKTIDPRTNLVEAKVENYMQTIVQMGLIRELTEYKPEYDLLTYTDASFWSEVSEFVVQFDQKMYDTAKLRADIIINADKGTDLKPEGWIAGGKECSFCPWVGPCGVERRSVPMHNAKATPQFVAEIADYAIKCNNLTASIEFAEHQLRDLQNTIKERLRDKGVSRIDGVVNWYKVAGKQYYSAKGMRERLQQLGEDTDRFAKLGEPSDRLVITATSSLLPTAIALPENVGVKRLKKGKGKETQKNPKSKSNKSKAKSKRTTQISKLKRK